MGIHIYKSSSKILQNGHFSDTLHLERGCRQGDPISPYLFVLAVKLMGETFRNHPDIQGITIGGKEHRISQFADDTTLFMGFNEENLRRCMDILSNFHSISDLKINVEKTKVIKFGKLRDSRIILCDDKNLIWTNKFTSLGIDYDINDLDKITEIHLELKLLEIQQLCTIWQLRNLTLIGKINISKSIMISKLIHILLSLPSPKEETFKDIENIFLNFLSGPSVDGWIDMYKCMVTHNPSRTLPLP